MPELIRLDSLTTATSGDHIHWEKKGNRYFAHLDIGQVGQELIYYSMGRNGDVIRRVEYVDEAGLFGDASVNSLNQLPILSNHPPNNRFDGNRLGLQVGHLTHEVSRSDGNLTAQAVIDNYQAVDLIDQLRADGQPVLVSPCYDLANILPDANGKFIQRRGLYDHIAAPLRPGEGRGGTSIKMRLDSADINADLGVGAGFFGEGDTPPEPGKLYFFFNRADQTPATQPEKEKPTMAPIPVTLQNQAFTTEDQGLATAITRADSTITQLTQQLTESQTQLGQARAAAMRADTAQNPAVQQQQLTEAVQVWTRSVDVLRRADSNFVPNYQMGLNDLKKLVVAIAQPGAVPRLDQLRADSVADMSELNGMWAMVVNGNQVQPAVMPVRADSVQVPGWNGVQPVAPPAGGNGTGLTQTAALLQLVNARRADTAQNGGGGLFTPQGAQQASINYMQGWGTVTPAAAPLQHHTLRADSTDQQVQDYVDSQKQQANDSFW